MNNTKLSAVVANEAVSNDALVSSNHKKSTINKAYIKANYLPIEIWHIIREELNLQEVLNLRKVNTFFADKIVDIDFISKKFYVKNLSFYKQAYSISSYQNTIAPVLENLSPDIKLMIDEYIKENKNYPLFLKQLPKFIATKVAIATMSLETTGGTVKSFSFPNDHADFTVNTIGTHCACIKDLNQVIIFAITIKHGFQKVTSFQLSNHDESISYMQFTPKNNLLTYSSAKELTLWELNLNENKEINPPKKLWDFKLDKLLNKIVLFNTEKEFFLSYLHESNLYFYSQDNNKVFQEKLMNYSPDISLLIQQIENIIISVNNKSLAIIFCDTRGLATHISLCSLTNSREIENIYSCVLNVPRSPLIMVDFNTTGDIFVYQNCPLFFHILQKKNNQWFLISKISCHHLRSIKIMPNEKHLFLNSSSCRINCLIKPSYTAWKRGGVANYYIHPTALAVISFDKKTKQLNIISPTKKNFLIHNKDKLHKFYTSFIELLLSVCFGLAWMVIIIIIIDSVKKCVLSIKRY